MNDLLINLLREVSHGFQLRLQEMTTIEELKLAPFQARLLSVIARSPGISQSSLATATGRDKAQVARAIKELEKREFITRSEHETDWRAQCLALTPDGEQAWSLLDRSRTELSAKILSPLTIDERDMMCRTLIKLKQELDR